MSATSTLPLHTAPAPCSSPGFSAANVTVRSARTAAPGASPLSASTPDGMSMASTRGAQRDPGRVVGAAEPGPVGTIDDEVARRERVPAPHVGGVEHPYPGAAPGQEGRGDPAVGAVAALARHDDDAPAVGAAEQAERGVSHRRAGAADQDLVRDGAERGGVGRPHFVAGQDGAHGALLRDDEGDGDAVGVGERQVEGAGTPGARQLGRRAVQAEERRVACRTLPRRPAHLDVGEREAPDAGAERLHHGLLGGEPRRQALRHVGGSGGVGALGLGEAPLCETRAAVEHLPEPRHVDRVDAHADDGTGSAGDHSTVTVLARLRGRSGSWPCRRARR